MGRGRGYELRLDVEHYTTPATTYLVGWDSNGTEVYNTGGSDSPVVLTEEKEMNKEEVSTLYHVILVDAGTVGDEYRVAASRAALLMELGKDGIDADQIAGIKVVNNLTPENMAIYVPSS